MIKNFIKVTLSFFCVNFFTAIIYFVLFISGIIDVYELEEDYLGNFHIYILLFIVSSVIIFAIACVYSFNKKGYLIFVIEYILFGVLSNVFYTIWFNVNNYSILIILKRIIYNISNQDFHDSIGINIMALFISLLWSILTIYIGDKMKNRKIRNADN